MFRDVKEGGNEGGKKFQAESLINFFGKLIVGIIGFKVSIERRNLKQTLLYLNKKKKKESENKNRPWKKIRHNNKPMLVD